MRIRLFRVVLAAVALSIGCGGRGVFSPLVPDDPAPPDSPPAPEALPPPAWSPPPSGGTVLVLRDQRTAIVSDADRDVVWIVDTARQRPPALVHLDRGDEPGRAVEDSSGNVYVVLRGAGTVVAIDPTTAAVVSSRPVCSAPRGIAWDEGAGLVHVACAGGELVSFADGSAPARRVFVAPDLRDVVVSNGGVYATTFRRPAVYAVKPDGHVDRRIEFPGDGSGASDGSLALRAAATADGLAVLHQIVSTAPLGSRPSASGYYGSPVDSPTNPPIKVALTTFTALPDGDGAETTTPFFGLARDIAVTPPGQGDRRAVLADTPTGPALAYAGCAPLPVPLDTHAVAIAWLDHDHIVMQTLSTAARPAGALMRIDVRLCRVVDDIALDDSSLPQVDPRAFRGRDLFYSVTSSGFACASCHPEGGEDGRVWVFAIEGARRTPPLRGGITRTAPFHWDGTLRDFNALAHRVFTSRMGGRVLADSETAALGAWVDTVRTIPNDAPADPDAVARGDALFHAADVGCAGCHSGPRYTNNQTVDVGTGLAAQVPSLVGLAYRAPYMHDGCATTLRDRFTPCGGSRHGNTSQLSSAQIDDLVAYLATL